MSLATYASPYNNNDDYNVIDEKKKYRNRTAKRKENKNNNPKVQAMMREIYDDNEEDNNGLSDFKPLGPPQSMAMENNDNERDFKMPSEFTNNEYTPGPSFDPQPVSQYENTGSYTNQYVPSLAPSMPNYYNNNGVSIDKDELLEKMNYIIYMLEEQKNVKTDNIMEELILYTFLGVFVIFVVDSFARAGKYTR